MNSPVDLIGALEQEPELALMVTQPPIAFHRTFVDVTGSALAALLLSAYVEQQEGAGLDGFFAPDAAEIERRFGLTKKEQSAGRKQLHELGFVRERRMSFPARLELTIDFDRISEVMVRIARQRARIAQESGGALMGSMSVDVANGSSGTSGLSGHWTQRAH